MGDNFRNNAQGIIDFATFDQILEMDDDDGREFSRTIVFEFFKQARGSFEEMDEKLKSGDLPSLSSLGHFLKGSSATLGLIKLKEACEKIQHLGAGNDETGFKAINNTQDSLSHIRTILTSMKKDYETVEKLLKNFYEPED